MKTIKRIPIYTLLAFLKLYQWFVSPFYRPCCRFIPSCSHYAVEAAKKHRFLIAILLISKRLAKCHPWGGSGYDPVPDVTNLHIAPKQGKAEEPIEPKNQEPNIRI